MSLSRPSDNAPNPATRWFDWHGERGVVCYYDKDEKKTIDVPLPFGGIVLDQLSAVRGWDDSTKSGIFSNAVRDTREELMTVKSFKGGLIAEGRYKDIKAQVNAAGGHFETQVYIGFKRDDGLAIGVLSFKGAALGAWMDFSRAHRNEFSTRALQVASYTEGQKGRVVFRVPVFGTSKIADETLAQAVKLDETLQAWLDGYFKKNQRSAPAAPDADAHGGDDWDQSEQPAYQGAQQQVTSAGVITDDDIPF